MVFRFILFYLDIIIMEWATKLTNVLYFFTILHGNKKLKSSHCYEKLGD